MKKVNSKLPAYTLSELLVVLVIIGILILMALPVLMPLISRTRSLEAKQGLKHLHTLEKTYFYEYSKYTDDLKALGFEQEKLITEDTNGKANYRIEVVEASTSSFVAQATAVADFDGDGQFNVWRIDQDGVLEEITQD
jgi:type IV pilus assembly protein PilE